jgi:hypothetical protein
MTKVADAPCAALPAFSRVGIPRIATALFLPEHGSVKLEAWNASGPHPGFGCGPVYAVQVCDAVRSPRDRGGDLPRQPVRLAGHRAAGPPAWATVAGKRSTSCASLKATEPPPPRPSPAHHAAWPGDRRTHHRGSRSTRPGPGRVPQPTEPRSRPGSKRSPRGQSLDLHCRFDAPPACAAAPKPTDQASVVTGSDVKSTCG